MSAPSLPPTIAKRLSPTAIYYRGQIWIKARCNSSFAVCAITGRPIRPKQMAWRLKPSPTTAALPRRRLRIALDVLDRIADGIG